MKIIESFAKIASEHPNRIAMVDCGGERKTTYGELYELARKTAAWLQSKDLPANSFVPIRMTASMEYMAVEFGIWMAGHAIVPLGDNFPEERVNYILSHCEAPLVIDEATMKEIAKCTPIDQRAHLLWPDGLACSPAALFYTSGSTGNPKGITHTFGSIEFVGNSRIDAFGFSDDDIFGTGAPFYFVASLFIVEVLHLGGEVHLYPKEAMTDVHQLEEYILEYGITSTFISPQVLANYRNRSQRLRFVFTGSERVSGIAPQGYRLLNAYGLSETAGPVVQFEIDHVWENTPVGRPMTGVEIAILDESGKPVVPGEEGEICLRGDFDTEYFKDPEKTAKLWRGDWLHTGDLGRQLTDGNILYVNRKDFMVKINGQRVEPGEVEAIMKKIPDVVNAVVKGFTSDTGSQYLVAYFIGNQTEEAIKKELTKSLPAYMKPSFFVKMEKFPINANGKLDRKSLTPPKRVDLQGEYVAPRNDTERRLCEAFATVLGLQRFSIDDDFIRLGGDSIRTMKAMQLCDGLPLSTKLIYTERTPRRIAPKCTADNALKFKSRDNNPLSQTQLGIYTECMNREGEAAYNNPRLYRLGANVDLERLTQAIEQTINAHPYVQTRISIDEEGNPVQHREDPKYKQSVEKMSDADFDKAKTSLVQPFNLLKDQLFRIRIIRTNSNAYLFFDFHHIIFDGTSAAVLLGDFENAYDGNAPLPEKWSGFEIALEEEYLRDTATYADARKWYESEFGIVDADSQPIPDRNDAEPAFGKEKFILHSSLSTLDSFCAKHGVTPNALSTAAFAYLLGIYTNAPEALFATIYNGRHDLRTARTIGMLVKTLPVYARWDDNIKVSDLLTAVKEQMLGCMANDIFSFAELCAINNSISSRVLFAWQADLESPAAIGGETYEEIPLLENATGEPLTVQIFRQGDSLEILAEYHANLYSQEFIDHLLKCYDRILCGMMEYESLKEIPLLAPEEEAQLNVINDLECPYDESQTIISLFRRQAAGNPERVAIVLENRTFTYREVDELSDRIAQYIMGTGIQHGEVVSILIPRNEYMVIASIGALKAKCPYQPLDSTYPAERLNFMMKDANAALLITSEELRPIVSEYEGPVLQLRDIPSLPDTGLTLPEIAPDDRFTLLYTSGTTGVPKGCILTHRNLAAFCNWYRRYYDLRPDDRVGAYASYGFDANMMDMYPALTNGSACVVIPEDVRLDFTVLSDFMASCGITHQFMTTQVGVQFVNENPTHPTLRYLSIGGEKLMSMEGPESYRFYNVYGPTECTIFTSAYEIHGKEADFPIGRPLTNLKLYITDRVGRRVPIGAAGELWISGRQVSAGYLNRPEQTAKVFIENPFDSAPNYRRVYRSGDVVRFLEDGNVGFIGRRDSQVKIRGFRIELKEIEEVVRQFPDITDATVVAFDAPEGGKFVAAYVVSDSPVDVNALNTFIREQKPPYMVPAVTIQIDRIPLNQNMKVNKKALPVPERKSRESRAESGERPLNVLEQELVDIIKGVLKCGDVSVAEDLAFSGLTSISAIKVSMLIFKRFGINLPVKKLTSGATVLGIADEIIRSWMESREAKGESQESKNESEVRNAYPLSYSQQGVYFDCMKRPTEVIYNVPSMLSFDASTDPKRLAEAVKAVVKAHPYIMTYFKMQGGEVVQLREEHPVEVEVKEMSDEELNNYKRVFVWPFNLSRAPLYRLEVVKTESGVHLLMDFHHIVFDGTSMDVFFRDLKQSMEGRAPEKEQYSYYDYILDEKTAEKTAAYSQNKAFFDDMLRNFESASELPPDLKGKPENGALRERVRLLDRAAIDAYCAKHSGTPAAICLAAAAYTVSRYNGGRNVYLSTVSSGRENGRTSGSIGMFVKTLPLGLEVTNMTVRAFIARAIEVLSGAVEHQNYPFTQIAADYGFSPKINYACQLGLLEPWQIDGKPVIMEPLDLAGSKFNISIHIEDTAEGTAIVNQYNDALYSPEYIDAFNLAMTQVLDTMLSAPDSDVTKISLLDDEQRKVIESFRKEGTAPVEINLFHKGLEHQADLKPDHTALIASDGTFTYAELDAYANRVANAIIAKGVEPESRIALLLPRTSRFLMSLFGVLKAGSAYIPCDPEYPTERINHILNDSGARYVITTADRITDFPADCALDVEALVAHSDASRPNVDISPESLAYLIYTSGSTGMPKGVMLRHKGICNYLTDSPVNRHIHALVTDAHTYMSVTTVSFDMSLKEFATTLFNGLTLVFADEDHANNPVLLSKLFLCTGADAFNATPSRLQQYMELPAFCEVLKQCKVIMCGGEKYPASLLERLQKLTRSRIFNTYGPTEITVSSNAKELTHADEVVIGRPLLNYHEYIVDVDGNELPVGVTGELYIGGDGVAAGYNGLDEQTARQFVEYNGERVYKSGDYARWTPEGDVMVLGRKDSQVKLRGLRIELGEIESALAKAPGITQSVVLIRSIKGSEHLCAYFTAESDIDIDMLKNELRKTLTAYMIPDAFNQLPKMPLTPNGKIDTRNLPEPKLAAGGEGVEAVGETEKAFCAIFADILNLDKVGATDSFFDLGGTSLAVTRIIIEADKVGLKVAYGDVFTNPSPRKLATLIDGADSSAKSDPDAEFKDYDYTEIQKILDGNTLDSFRDGETQPLGNILLTGSTGFLGVHMLREFVGNLPGKVYCLLRGKNNMPAEMRLKSTLFYYFENSFDDLIGSRIIPVEGDITNPASLAALDGTGIDTVVNCAANVKHFSEGTDIEDVNLGGVANLVDYCLRNSSRLVQVSTMSVGGMSVDGKPAIKAGLTENMLYFGQYLANKYIRSKFLAERLILENIAKNGLSAKIMRVGNLAPRNSDGEFQMNYSTNSSMGRLKAYRMLGKCTFAQLDATMEFSPIDEVAKAIAVLATTPRECVMFHPYNHHNILIGDIFDDMKQEGFTVTPVEDADFAAALKEAEADPEKAKVLSSIIAYNDMAHGKVAIPIAKNNAYTMQVLYRLGYRWPATSWEYVARFLRALDGLGFFDVDE